MLETQALIDFAIDTQVDADGIAGAYIPRDLKLTHIGAFANVTGITGSPTAATIDVQDDASDVVTAHSIAANALTELSTIIYIAAGSLIEIDLNLTAGSTPAFSGNIQLIGDWGE